MTGAAGLAHLQQNRVLVAIDPNFENLLHVARRFALHPERLARAAPIGRAPGLQRCVQSVRIHPGHHQNSSGLHILRDRCNQTICIELRTQLVSLVLLGSAQGRLKQHFLLAISGSVQRCNPGY